MPEVKMFVNLTSHTANPLEVIYNAYRECYSAGGVERADERKMVALIKKCMASGHLSPLEHVSFTFNVSGISRACSHQLVRHRIASYTQQSQRYVLAENFDYVVPPAIAKNKAAKEVFNFGMWDAANNYKRLIDCGMAKEDARFLLPNAAATNITVTMNCRAMLHFFEERLCTRAQWEIRELASRMQVLCLQVLPVVFDLSGAKCERLGYCPEANSCGRMPNK